MRHRLRPAAAGVLPGLPAHAAPPRPDVLLVATRRLPRDVRPAVHALYGFVRGADEIVDGAGRLAARPARRAALDAWEAELDRGVRAGHSDHPVIAALVDAGDRHACRCDAARPLHGARCASTARPVRIATRDELDRYMDGTAGSVGRIMAPLLGAPPEAHGDVARLGVAFQLTNFIRDVREDWRLDRVYLPGPRPRTTCARATATAGGPRAGRPRGRPRPRAVRRDGARDRRAARRRCARASASRAASTCGCSTGSSATASTSSARRAALAPGRRPRGRRIGARAAMTRPGDTRAARSGRSLDGDARRRPRLRRELRRARGRARARRQRRATCWSSTATRSASARRRPAPRRRRGCTRWASRRSIRQELPA